MCLIWASGGGECNELSLFAWNSVQSGKLLLSSGETSILYNKDDGSGFFFDVSKHIFI